MRQWLMHRGKCWSRDVMNFWHMQLHPNEANEWSRKDILDLVNLNVIGVGKGWKGDRNCPEKFNEEMAIGDIVLIRHEGPLCLVQITSNSFENKNKSVVDAWFYYCREVKILAIDLNHTVQYEYKSKYKKSWNEGLFLITTMDKANDCQFVRYWYDLALKEKSNNHNVEPSLYAVNEILQQNLSIPPYQRPYKWERPQVEQLLSDIYNHKQSGNTKSRYRIGSLILCIDRSIKNDKKFKDFTIDIVDGQQRITTLLLILLALNPNYSNILFDQLEYNHSSSYENINKNKTVITDWIKEKNLTEKDCIELFEYIVDRCELVQVIVYNISEAFQMFDSQNGTGKELEAYNLLKAYHLRAIKKADEQKKYDIQWENAVKYFSKKDEKNIDILKQLFNEQLYRTRIWSKNEYAYTFSKQKIDEFKGLSINEMEKLNFSYLNPILLNFYISNSLKEGKVTTSSKTLNNYFSSLEPSAFIFLNQLIINGEQFFEYINKYTEMYKVLFMSDNDINGFQSFYIDSCMYDKRDRNGDRYLRELYKSLIMSLYDRFGENGLIPPIYKMFYAFVFKNRIEMRSVFYRSVVNLPIDADLNPFDVINQAKNIRELKTLEYLCRIDKKTIKEVCDEHKDKSKKRKSARYVQAIIDFFNEIDNQRFVSEGE